MDESKIKAVPMEEVLPSSMLPYAEYVILDRAIPRVEDGLKPVQRRILYSMYELGLQPDKPYVKSTRVVGECMGKYHPHGDTSIYDAMVKLAQPFNMRSTLVDGQGNFGSNDGDRAAASRYTEVRLNQLAMQLLRDIDKDTVDMTLTFDDTRKEPIVLPGRFPNLLVNGAYGIAVGIATNIPTHNLKEVINGCIAYIDNENITLRELMKYIPAPDFPTGGYIFSDQMEEIYATGRGKVMMRAKVKIENEGKALDKKSIIITELPYQIDKPKLLRTIADLRDSKNSVLMGIGDITDESDLSGMRVVIKVKKGFDAQEILTELYAKTNMESAFNVNMVAIAEGKPKQLSLIDMLSYYVRFQQEIILRRSKFELEEARERAHILEGLLVAVRNIDEVVAIIKASKSTTEARTNLMKRFSLSERQAQAILDMRLARLTSLEVFKLQEEYDALEKQIAFLITVIKDKDVRNSVLKKELVEIKNKFGDARKSAIIGADSQISDIVEIKNDNEDSVLVVSHNDLIRRQLSGAYEMGFKDKSRKNKYQHGERIKVKCSGSDDVFLLTNLGTFIKTKMSDIPDTPFSEEGKPINEVFTDLKEGEKFVYGASFDKESDSNLIIVTKLGMTKKSKICDYIVAKRMYNGIKLADNDEIIAVLEETRDETIIISTKSGMCLHFSTDEIPVQGRISAGVKGINLSNGDEAVSAVLVGKAGELVVLTNKANGKRVLISQIPVTSRYRKGVKLIDFKAKSNDKIMFTCYVKMPCRLFVYSDTNDISVINSDSLPIEKRETRGKPIETVKYFDSLKEANKDF